MANDAELSYLTNGDYIDYWNQFLRFYANETGKNLSPKIPISYLEKTLKDEIIKKYELESSPYSTNVTSLVRQLIKKGAIEFETLRPDEKFTEKYEKAVSRIFDKLKSELNPAYKVDLIENNPYEVRLFLNIDIEDWLKLSEAEKQYAYRMGSVFGNTLKKLLGIEFGSTIHGKLNYYSNQPAIDNFDTWMKNVMNKKIKKQIKESEFGKYVQRMKVGFISDKLRIEIIPNRQYRYSAQNSGGLRDLIPELFEKLGYNPDSVEVRFV